MNMRLNRNEHGSNRGIMPAKGLSLALLLSLAFMAPTFAADLTPTLDKLHDQDPTANPQTSAYTLSPTTETEGENIYNIPEYDAETQTVTDKYYELNTKEGVNSNTRLTNTTDNSTTNVTGHFIDREVTSTTANVYGAAIYNSGESAKLGDITGDFVGNELSTSGSKKYAYGGAIYNAKGTIGNITGDFVENSIKSEAGAVFGGAIYNTGTLGDIKGNFIGNSSTGTYTSFQGGAIYNTGTIDSITGNFIGNSATTDKSTVYGGAIYNTGRIGDIVGDFIDNSVNGTSTGVRGGGIFSSGSINSIIGNFIGNKSNRHRGGAIEIANNGTVNLIKGDFINNYAYGYGGAIAGGSNANNSTVLIGNFINNYAGDNGGALYGGYFDTITGDFIGNTAKARYGGALYGVTANEVTGNFINNSAGTYGGAIIAYENYRIDKITGDFIGNTAKTGGGAIYVNTEGTMGDVNGNFDNNSVVSEQSFALGGAICNAGTLGSIAGDYTNNFATGVTYAYGGAIYNNGAMGDISGNFEDNSINAGSSYAYGGAIYNGTSGIIGDITGDFTNNSAYSEKHYPWGGAIYNKGTTGNIYGDFTNNHITANTYAYGGAIYNNGIMGEIHGNFVNNTSYAAKYVPQGGAIYNGEIIGNIYGDFINNSITAETDRAYGGAISNYNGTLHNITGNFKQNSIVAPQAEAFGGAILNIGTLGDITGDFTGNSVTGGTYAWGGAIRGQGTFGNISGDFLNNYAKSTSDTYLALGGAIYHTTDGNNLNLVADDRTMTFDGNYTEDYRGKINNAIFVRTSSATAINDDDGNLIGYEYTEMTPKVTLNATNGGAFILNDNIDGGKVVFDDIHDGAYHGMSLERTHQYDLDIKGDSTGQVQLNNDILNANITHQDLTTNVGHWTYLSHAQGEGINALTMQSGVMNIPYLTAEPVTLTSFNMNGGTINIDKIDVDLQGIKMGRFLADDNSGGGGTINVNSLNLLNTTARMKTLVPFADTSFADTVQYNGEKVIAASPIFIYDVGYENLSDGGYFSFTRHNNSFNPAVLVSPVATQISGQATMNQAFHYVFEHADAFTQMPALDRFARIHGNEYALSTDYNNNLGSLDATSMNKGVWVRPYTSFDKTSLKNGPDVKSINYGTIIGADTDFRKLRNGWTNVGTGYVGYFGSQADFEGVDTTMNGGLLGITETFYKGNFFTALTASAGGGFAESHTNYGKDDITMFMSGIASKTGYNIEFKEGKFIIQPLLKMDYTMVNTFDYTNAAGVKIDNKPMHTIQLNPGVRFIGNLEGGWQPYAGVGMVWNLMNETNTTANGIKLPEMQTKPYVEYGVGLQRHWSGKFSAFGQAMVRNGGRTGIALTLGFRWAFGEPKTNNETQVKHNDGEKKVIKTSSRKIIRRV